MDSLEVLKAIAQQVRNATEIGENTAERVGRFLVGIIEWIKTENFNEKYLRKDIEDWAQQLIHFMNGIDVKNHAVFNDTLSSDDFVSGFTSGKGWAIWLKNIINAAGANEKLACMELDELTIRKTLKVFEFIISQMRGENDNVTFSGFMKVDHYDPETGRIYLKTDDGQLYNPFRVDDYLYCQQFNGMPSEENDYTVIKTYEFIVTDAQVGSMEDKDKRLDWITLKNFNGDLSLIQENDVLVRLDNLSNPDRKGIIQMMTVGNETPYMDILYGTKTDPDNALKSRFGNLQGVYSHLFGWLQAFGAYIVNLYAVGDFRIRQTGEDLDSKVEMIKGMFQTHYQQLTHDLTEDDNYLKNAAFTENLEGWIAEDDVKFITLNDDVLYLNRSTVVNKGRVASIEEYDGKNMLHLSNSYVRQLNANIRKPGTHKEYNIISAGEVSEEYTEVKDTLYLSLKFFCARSGTLTIGFEGSAITEKSLPYTVMQVASSSDWLIYKWSGDWDGKGDFVLKFTGDIYVSLLAVTDNPLNDYKKEVSTSIQQTASNIRLLGTNINHIKNTVTNLGIELDAAKERISIYANKLDTLTGTVTNLGIELDAAKEHIALYSTKVSNNEASISALQIKADSILSTVTSVQGDLEQAKKTASAAAQAAMDKATQADNNANDAWWKAYYAQQDADSAYSKSVSNATAIAQIDTAVSILAGRFTSDGRLVNTGGLLVTADKTELSNEIYDINGKLAKKAEISTSVQYNPSTGKVTSNVKVAADQVILEGHVTANGNVEITPDGRIIGKSASFENTVMRYKVNDISFLTTKVYYNTWANINAISSANLNEYDLAVLSGGTYIDGVWYAARTAFVYRDSQWKLLPGLSVYTSTDSGGNVSVSYAVLNLNPSDGNIVVLDAPVKLYVVAPETGPGNYGTTIKLMSMTQAVARNVISGQWANREYHVGRYSSSVSENIVMTGRAGSTINVGGYCELVSTPLGWLATANVGMVNDRMIARLKIKYISSSRTYSVSSECLYNYSSGSFYTSRTAAGSVVVSIPYALVSDVNASDIKVYGTGVVFDVDKNTVISKAPGKATLQSYYQENSSLAKALVYISDDDTLNDGDFVMEIYKYSNTYICEKSSISG